MKNNEKHFSIKNVALLEYLTLQKFQIHSLHNIKKNDVMGMAKNHPVHNILSNTNFVP